MEVTPSSTQLGCGRDIDDVWENVSNAPSPHEVTCPDCQSARGNLASLVTATEELRRDDITDTDLQTSPQVIDRVLNIARAEVRRGRRLPLRQADPDQTSDLTVSEQAVATVIRRVGDQSTGIQIRRCSITLITQEPSAPQQRYSKPPLVVSTQDASPDGAVVGQAPAAKVRVALRISIGHPVAIVGQVEALRMNIIDVVNQEIGMNVVGVDVAVEDIHD